MVKLSDLFIAKQAEMQASLNLRLDHPVAQGDNTEVAWVDFFNEYLPSRYKCSKGFVVDSKGKQSQQIDLIVYDTYFSPFLLNNKANKYIPAESVYAVFEIKPELSKANFEYAQNKIASVRKLCRTSAPVMTNGKLCPGREPFPIIGGLLTISSRWGTQLPKQAVNPDDYGFLNMGCCVGEKSWIAKENSKTKEFKYVWNTNNDEALLSFFMALLFELQIRGTVTAMDIPKYFDGFK